MPKKKGKKKKGAAKPKGKGKGQRKHNTGPSAAQDEPGRDDADLRGSASVSLEREALADTACTPDESQAQAQCALCGINRLEVTLKCCARCRCVMYCSKEHQTEHWHDAHRDECWLVIKHGYATKRMIQTLMTLDQTSIPADKLGEFLLWKGTVLRYGIRVKQDAGEAIALFRRAVTECEPDSEALFQLGYACATGTGLRDGIPNYTEAFQRFQQAAQLGSVPAVFNMGVCYEHGRGVGKSSNRATQMYRQAAERGDADAQYNYGNALFNGDGTRRNVAAALQFYRKAAAQGLPDAHQNLGALHSTGGEGVSQDESKAFEHFMVAADHGIPQAQCSAGICFNHGRGVPGGRDPTEAAKWFKRAAKQGNAKAQFNLGMYYARGEGVPMDMREAARWWQQAADQGHRQACECLAQHYAEKDPELGQSYAQKAMSGEEGCICQ